VWTIEGKVDVSSGMIHESVEESRLEFGPTKGVHDRGVLKRQMHWLRYLHRFEFMQRHVWNKDEEDKDAKEVLQGTWKPYVMRAALQDIAHKYVLGNATIMEDFYA